MMEGNGLAKTVGRSFAAKARKLLYLFWSKDCGKRDLDTYMKTAKEIQKGFEKIGDQILDGVWTSGKRGSVSKAMHRLEGVTWTLVRECEVIFEIGATTLSLVCEEIARTWYHALRALLPLHSMRFCHLKTPSKVHWEVTYRKERMVSRFEEGSLRRIAFEKVLELVAAADEEEGINSGIRNALLTNSHGAGAAVAEKVAAVGEDVEEETTRSGSMTSAGAGKKGGNLSAEGVHMEELCSMCARSALRFRAAAEKLYGMHRKGTIRLSENALGALARGAAVAIATAESNALLNTKHASAFEDELVDTISSEREVLVAENASERMQEEQRTGNLTRTARAQFEEKIQKKRTKPKGKTKAKTTRLAKVAQEDEHEDGEGREEGARVSGGRSARA